MFAHLPNNFVSKVIDKIQNFPALSKEATEILMASEEAEYIQFLQDLDPKNLTDECKIPQIAPSNQAKIKNLLIALPDLNKFKSYLDEIFNQDNKTSKFKRHYLVNTLHCVHQLKEEKGQSEDLYKRHLSRLMNEWNCLI